MGRGKKKVAVRAQHAADRAAAEEAEDSDDDGSSSVFSDVAPSKPKAARSKRATHGGDSSGDEAADPTEFLEYIELMGEKRVAVRREAMQGLLRMLNKDDTLDEVLAEMADTICLRCLALVKKGTTEAVVALRLLTVVFIVNGTDSEAIYPDVAKELHVAARSHTSAAVRAAALSALTTCYFVAGTEEEHTAVVMGVLREALAEDPKDKAKLVNVAALQGLSLMHSLLDEETQAATAQAILEVVPKLEEAETRLEAGVVLAVLVERAWEQADGSSKLVQGVMPPGLLERVAVLAADSDASERHRQSKKDRKAQKAGMRDVLALLERGECTAGESLTVHKRPVEFECWGDLARLYAMRRVLLEGFQFQLQHSALLRDIFGENQLGAALDEAAAVAAGGEDSTRLTPHEKRKYMSKNSAKSKARTRSISKKRADRVELTYNYWDSGGEAPASPQISHTTLMGALARDEPDAPI